jgi:hypothetical protein
MSEDKLNQALAEAREAKEKAVEAYQYAEKAESNILHQMEIHHIKIANQVNEVSDDVKMHRTIISTIAGVIGLAVLGAMLKGIGL